MRWSERPPAVRPRSGWLLRLPSGPRALSVAVAHLVLVRPMRLLSLLRCIPVAMFLAAVPSHAADLHTLSGFEAAFRAAHASRDLSVMDTLICWDGVSSRHRSEVRAAIQSDFRNHIDELKIIAPANRYSTEPRRIHGRLCHPNLAVTHTMLVTLALNDPGKTENLPIGRREGRFYIASFVPSTR
jgi:hypothetical protein